MLHRRVVVFYHVYAASTWEDVVADQVTKLIFSGLYHEASAILVGIGAPEQQVRGVVHSCLGQPYPNPNPNPSPKPSHSPVFDVRPSTPTAASSISWIQSDRDVACCCAVCVFWQLSQQSIAVVRANNTGFGSCLPQPGI